MYMKKKVEVDELENSIIFYLNRPHPFYKILIGMFLFIICSIIIFMCVVKIEITVKAEGEVINKSTTTYVTNIVDGKIKKCYVRDGQEVKGGDVIYELEYDDYEKDLNNLQIKKAKKEERIEILKAYQKWLSNPKSENDFDKNSIYYDVYRRKSQNIFSKISSLNEEVDNQISQLSLNIKSTEQNIKKINIKLKKLKKASLAIKTGKNNFNENEYGYCIVQNYLCRCNNIKIQYEEKISYSENKKTMKLYKKQKKAELEICLQETLASVQELIVGLEDIKSENKDTLKSYVSTQKYLNKKKLNNTDITELINSEKVTIEELKVTCEAELEEIKDEIKIQEEKIEDFKVYASRDGYINFLEDYVEEGNFVYAGNKLMSIISKGEKIFIEAYIRDSDFGEIKKGMGVKCEINTFPHEEYGYLTGSIISISKAIKLTSENGNYYKVVVELDKTLLLSENGTEYKIKPGMTCNIRVITKEKRIIKYLLQKINLLD